MKKDTLSFSSVLVVDDDPAFLRMVEKLLDDVQVSTATSIKEGLQKCLYEQPVVTILDVNFKNSDLRGIDYVARFREECFNMEVIVVTSDYREDDENAADEAGACGYCEKGDFTFLRRLVNAARLRVSREFSSEFDVYLAQTPSKA